MEGHPNQPPTMLSLIPRLFQRAPEPDTEARQWVRAVTLWARRQAVWAQPLGQAHLVLPIREHFPGQADTRHGMAQIVFDAVCSHAGFADGPFRLAQPDDLLDNPVPMGSWGHAPRPESIPIPYDPRLVGENEALIGHFARELALRLLPTSEEPAPSQEGNEGHVAELLATQMGFGVMLANTAFHVRVGGCGSCSAPSAERQASLGRDDLVYALALFCHHQGIAPSRARTFLNKPLRPVFRQATRSFAQQARQSA